MGKPHRQDVPDTANSGYLDPQKLKKKRHQQQIFEEKWYSGESFFFHFHLQRITMMRNY